MRFNPKNGALIPVKSTLILFHRVAIYQKVTQKEDLFIRRFLPSFRNK